MRYALEERVTHDQMHLQEGLQDMCVLPGYAYVPPSGGSIHPCRG